MDGYEKHVNTIGVYCVRKSQEFLKHIGPTRTNEAFKNMKLSTLAVWPEL